MVVSNLSRGDMRVLIDIPLYAQTDLDEIYRIISKVNEEAVPEHPEILKEPDVLGPQMASNGPCLPFKTSSPQAGSLLGSSGVWYYHLSSGLAQHSPRHHYDWPYGRK